MHQLVFRLSSLLHHAATTTTSIRILAFTAHVTVLKDQKCKSRKRKKSTPGGGRTHNLQITIPYRSLTRCHYATRAKEQVKVNPSYMDSGNAASLIDKKTHFFWIVLLPILYNCFCYMPFLASNFGLMRA